MTRHPHAGRNRAFLAGLFAAAGLLSSAPSSAGPLDPEDRAKVAEIDGKVDLQIDAVGDALVGMDELVDAAEFANREVEALLDINSAQLRLDLEQMLLTSCAPKCAKSPAPPSSATSAKRCWKCANPRLMLKNDDGGYLEDVIGLVASDLLAVVEAGLPLDVDTARRLLDQARDAFQAGFVEDSFTFSCQAFGVLACDHPASLRSAGPPLADAPLPAGFAGLGSRSH